MDILYAFFIILFTTIGQILLKKGALCLRKNKMYLYIFIGYFFFVLAVLLSYELLKLIPLKYYTVVMSLNYITVLFGAYIFLNEKINKIKIKGTFMIAVGIFIFLYKG